MRRAVGAAPARDNSAPVNDSVYEWQSPDGSVTVRVGRELLAALAEELEAGGVLLGTVNVERRCTVVIRGVERVEGQFWRAHTSEERLALDLAMARARAEGAQPLGYYRPSTEERLGPVRDDLLLISRHFTAPYNVFLFVRPNGKAGFSCWEHGQLLEAVPDEFELANPVQKPPRRPVPAAAPTPAPKERRESSELLPYVLVAIALILLLVAAGVLIVSRDAPARTPPPPVAQKTRPLALNLERAGSDYRVTWDREAAPVQSAARGFLTIADGLFKSEIELDIEQLRTGSLLYTPASGDVLIQLRVTGPGGELAESVRALSAGARDDTGALTAAAPLKVQPVEPRPAPVAEARAHVAPVEVRTVLTPTREFRAPQQQQPDLAALAPPTLSGSDALPAVNGPAPRVPPAPEPPKETAAAQPEPPRRISNFVPPRAIQQHWPVPTDFVRSAMQRSGDAKGQVDVEVAIDATGRVISAQAVNSTGWAGRLLTPQSVDAALRWRFEPARLNGEAIQSRMVLSFRLGEDGKR